ncbi:MAG: cysteine methyltransferase [Zetaproteobacteria bacterium CG12_big_fil_rev_8_21_14_0_65_55_1124]|nr:MAG: cysteine methyltransferase [Zetaproteobacteria bacterium CG1_02_55_237]PIS19836.1 MAG: cysteine methyltransferase [Zetaproteobacteria bacterium CG08_land_8_20_14_0_20_55_17]PIW42865.1 MAG: cysteine methyltransferase [Zetaproteobacteria bacterium CG12_big_fil_rev_8_21_14_0_65_55_1124]PIY51683.1 MAG: cysteine methyltransferase [Zetaproteobacteria bacterium CG_4_10_14_0_8_um_filter_55_43]PIZ39856.1 MAG: cysteine methyltransferase [Zetaproteobacteria bacterium CG_4_10_14_0_2_um_filter_55_20
MGADTFRYSSPLGELSYCWDGEVCREVNLLDAPADNPTGSDPIREWLDAYFSGEVLALPPLAAARSPFQASMRQCLLNIPRGETLSYGEAAKQLGTAPRAMGQALGANPLPILIPCHRVVAAHGLGGFSCGLEWKRRLLAFESGGTKL